MSRRLWWLLVPSALAAVALYWWWPVEERPVLEPRWAATVGVIGDSTFADPYGVTAAPDGLLYVSDGASGNRIHAVAGTGEVTAVAGGAEGFADGPGHVARFRTPSGIAADRDGTLYVADTGNNAIRSITRDGEVSTLTTALNGPMGVAIDSQGRVLATDTYNDRLVAVDGSGIVIPLHLPVALDTPTGLAVGPGGTIYVADTGNHVIRAIAADGAVTTLDAGSIGGLRYPIGVATDAAGAVYVTDATARVIELFPNRPPGEARVVAGSSPGFRNGAGSAAQFRDPAGLAALAPGRLLVADAGNALLRHVTAVAMADAAPPPSPRLAPRFDVEDFTQRPLLWPLDPLYGPFEVAGTLGEARGEDAGRFHAGIDVRAEHGSPVLAVRDAVVRSPLATGDFDSLNEWLRAGSLAYVHLRVGRTRGGDVIDPNRFVASRDAHGRITRIRVKRGSHFRVGDLVGTVNRFNHIHLNVGWGGEEYNPLLFRLVQFEDTVSPTIARGGIRIVDAGGTPVDARRNGRLLLSGPVQVIVDAWDQADGNRPSRRLGVYSLGYQVLRSDGTPAPGFETPLETIRFDRLVTDQDAAHLVYASGSGIPFYGQRRTRFLYIVTNTFRDGVAAAGLWDPTSLAPGDYILRVRVADLHGNEAQLNRDLAVTIAGREPASGG
jgi:hypothetical protein